MGGPTGFDYNVMHHRLDRMKLPEDEYNWLETDIRIMESAAITAMHAKT